MRILADQDVYAATIRFMIGLGHDVTRAADLGLGAAEDTELLRTARQRHHVLLTRDRDFGRLVYTGGMGAGVIYLRMSPSTQDAVHAELRRVLTLNTDETLQRSFVVAEPGRHRMRTYGLGPTR